MTVDFRELLLTLSIDQFPRQHLRGNRMIGEELMVRSAADSVLDLFTSLRAADTENASPVQALAGLISIAGSSLPSLAEQFRLRFFGRIFPLRAV